MPFWAWYMVQTITCCRTITIKDFSALTFHLPAGTFLHPRNMWHSGRVLCDSNIYAEKNPFALHWGSLPTQKWTLLRRRNIGHSCEASNANWCKCLPRTKIYFYTRIGHSSKTQLLTFLQSPQVAKFLKPLSIVWPPSSQAPLHHSYCYKMVTETSSLLRVDDDGEDVDDDCR